METISLRGFSYNWAKPGAISTEMIKHEINSAKNLIIGSKVKFDSKRLVFKSFFFSTLSLQIQ
jgi:hypothetical protein